MRRSKIVGVKTNPHDDKSFANIKIMRYKINTEELGVGWINQRGKHKIIDHRKRSRNKPTAARKLEKVNPKVKQVSRKYWAKKAIIIKGLDLSFTKEKVSKLKLFFKTVSTKMK